MTPSHTKLVPAPGCSQQPQKKPALRYFGDYVLLGEIARGGMGIVYRALQVSLDREVAIKMIDAGALANEAAVRRFHTEAEAMAKLDHPNIVSIYEIGRHEGHHYFAMKLVDGPSLAEHLGNQPMNPRAAAELLAGVAHAVQYAHDRGVLHRDLKPGNILIDSRGQPYVTDFGIAKLVRREAAFTSSNVTMGTPQYMAPEQAVGKLRDVGTAADIYSLGAVLYHLLTAEAPFTGETPFEILERVIKEPPLSPTQRNPAVDEALAAICLKCLEKKPQDRYRSAGELAQALDEWRFSNAREGVASSPLVRTLSWTRRHPTLAALGAGALLILGVVLALHGLPQRHADTRHASQHTNSPTTAASTPAQSTNDERNPLRTPAIATNTIYLKTGAAGVVRERREKTTEGDRAQYFSFTGRLQKQVLLATNGTKQTNTYDYLARPKRQEAIQTNGCKVLISFAYDHEGQERSRETFQFDVKGKPIARIVVVRSLGLLTNQTVTNQFVRGRFGWVNRPGNPIPTLVGDEGLFAPDNTNSTLAHWLTDWLIDGYFADRRATGHSAAQLYSESSAAREEAREANKIAGLAKDLNQIRDARSAAGQAESRARALQQKGSQAEADAAFYHNRKRKSNAAPIAADVKAQVRRQVESLVATRQSKAGRTARGDRVDSPDVTQALADPAHVFVVSKALSATLARNSSAACTLNAGNMLRFEAVATNLPREANEYTLVPATIVASAFGDVAVGTTVLISLRDLQEFDSEFRIRVDLGLAQACLHRALGGSARTAGCLFPAHEPNQGSDSEECQQPPCLD